MWEICEDRNKQVNKNVIYLDDMNVGDVAIMLHDNIYFADKGDRVLCVADDEHVVINLDKSGSYWYGRYDDGDEPVEMLPPTEEIHLIIKNK